MDPTTQPKADLPPPMADYPRNLVELRRMFSEKENCLAHLEHLRWGGRFTCSACPHQGDSWSCSPGVRKCPRCRKENVVTAGSVFYRSKVSLDHWFRAAWDIVDLDFSVWTKYLRETTKVGDQGARGILRDLRRAMNKADEKLSGIIQIDELELELRKDPIDKLAGKADCRILVAAEVKEMGNPGRVRMHVVDSFDRKTLQPLIARWVLPRSELHTDSWRGYNGLSNPTKCTHTIVSDKLGVNHKRAAMPVIRKVHDKFLDRFPEEQRSGMTPNHLQLYLNEFTFIQNSLGTERGLRFNHLLELALKTAPNTQE